jgi:hypothetical protein
MPSIAYVTCLSRMQPMLCEENKAMVYGRNAKSVHLLWSSKASLEAKDRSLMNSSRHLEERNVICLTPDEVSSSKEPGHRGMNQQRPKQQTRACRSKTGIAIAPFLGLSEAKVRSPHWRIRFGSTHQSCPHRPLVCLYARNGHTGRGDCQHAEERDPQRSPAREFRKLGVRVVSRFIQHPKNTKFFLEHLACALAWTKYLQRLSTLIGLQICKSTSSLFQLSSAAGKKKQLRSPGGSCLSVS